MFLTAVGSRSPTLENAWDKVLESANMSASLRNEQWFATSWLATADEAFSHG